MWIVFLNIREENLRFPFSHLISIKHSNAEQRKTKQANILHFSLIGQVEVNKQTFNDLNRDCFVSSFLSF